VIKILLFYQEERILLIQKVEKEWGWIWSWKLAQPRWIICFRLLRAFLGKWEPDLEAFQGKKCEHINMACWNLSYNFPRSRASMRIRIQQLFYEKWCSTDPDPDPEPDAECSPSFDWAASRSSGDQSLKARSTPRSVRAALQQKSVAATRIWGKTELRTLIQND